jgi:hypothetical protein
MPTPSDSLIGREKARELAREFWGLSRLICLSGFQNYPTPNWGGQDTPLDEQTRPERESRWNRTMQEWGSPHGQITCRAMHMRLPENESRPEAREYIGNEEGVPLADQIRQCESDERAIVIQKGGRRSAEMVQCVKRGTDGTQQEQPKQQGVHLLRWGWACS